jgi:hypothetical protein
MEKKVKNFLKFNGKNLLFVSIDGTFWVAIKPICDALGLNTNRIYKNLKSDLILKDVVANQPMRDTKNRLQNMVALPEKYVYGWLFSVNSGSDALQQYKKKCYDLLYEHFQGAVTKRTNELSEKTWAQRQAETIRERLKLENEDYKKLCELEGKILQHGKNLKVIDQQLVDSQLSLFN